MKPAPGKLISVQTSGEGFEGDIISDISSDYKLRGVPRYLYAKNFLQILLSGSTLLNDYRGVHGLPHLDERVSISK